MTAAIPPQTLDLLADNPALVAALSTINPNGQPHTVPVWFDFDGTNVRVNSPDSARKARNMEVGTKVTLLIISPQNPYHWVEIMGHVAEVWGETGGGRDHINKLAKKYRGADVYESWGGRVETRSTYVIAPDKVLGY